MWEDGLVSRGHLERRQLEDESAEALAYARAAAYDDPDAAQVLGQAEFPEVPLYDEQAAAVARGETGPLAERLAYVRGHVDEGAFHTWSGSFSASEGSSRLITSAGLDVSGRGTGTSWFVYLNGEIGDGFGARRAESPEDFRARLGRLMKTAEQLAVDATPMPGGVHPVILHPRVVEQYALDTLIHHLEGSTIDHRREPLPQGAVRLGFDGAAARTSTSGSTRCNRTRAARIASRPRGCRRPPAVTSRTAA